MLRRFSCLFTLCLLASRASAHFVFVVPQANGLTAQVFLSETLTADAQIDASYVKDAKLFTRDAAGHDTALTLESGKEASVIKINAGTRVIHGDDDLGVTTREADHPYVLIYHPKTILGNAFDGKAALGPDTPAEIVPMGKIGAVQFKLLINGKPAANAEITVLVPDGTSKKVTTNNDGLTEPFTAQGRYGAWARNWENSPGVRDGKKYDEIRHYATVVFDAGISAPQTMTASRPALTATRFGTLPEATTSFGAVASNGWLYVYGGHIAPTHSYSTDAVSGKFNRLKLSDGKTWETLPAGPAMQGMNLAAYNGKIYRVGGMTPRNKPGDPEDVWSTAQSAVFDPTTRTWDALPDLPTARSSHDVAVIGDTLYVVGGWNLKGSAGTTQWCDTLLAMDLKSKPLTWKTTPQPFKRRAFIAATLQGKLYVIGGFNEDSDVLHDVAIFDPQSATWSKGPDLPGDEQNGFGPAACTLDGKLFVSVADGTLYRLSAKGDAWEAAGTSTPRIVHRLAPDGAGVLVIGGAAEGHNFDLIEQVIPKVQKP